MRLNRSYGVLEYEDMRNRREQTVMGTAFGPNNCRERRQTAISVIDANIPDIILGAQTCRAPVSTLQAERIEPTDECRGFVQTSDMQNPIYRNPNGGK
jgi:hypothetical protein